MCRCELWLWVSEYVGCAGGFGERVLVRCCTLAEVVAHRLFGAVLTPPPPHISRA